MPSNTSTTGNGEKDFRKISHDLRNILGSINNYAQILELSLKKAGMEKEIDFVKEIESSIKEMDALISREINS